jgi:hypothetical protein
VKYFLVLTLLSVGAFIFVLRMRPELFYSAYPAWSYPSTNGAVTVPPPTTPEKKNTKVASRSRSARAGSDVVSTAVEPLERQPDIRDISPRGIANGPRVARATVTADTLPIFATNSSKSRVVMVLNKGDLVQTDLIVIDSLGHWSFVTVPGRRISGYVRSEDIDRVHTASNN